MGPETSTPTLPILVKSHVRVLINKRLATQISLYLHGQKIDEFVGIGLNDDYMLLVRLSKNWAHLTLFIYFG